MRTHEDIAAEPGRGEAGRLFFIDHDRQRYAGKVRLPNAGEILVGEYLEDGGVGPLGELRIVLHDLGDRGGLLQAQLCVFGDGVAALAALVGAGREDDPLAAVLLPVSGHEELSRRLVALGLRDASDTPLPGGEGGPDGP